MERIKSFQGKNEYENQKILVLKTKTKNVLIDATNYSIALTFMCMGKFDEPAGYGFHVWQGNLIESVTKTVIVTSDNQHDEQTFFDDIAGIGGFRWATNDDLKEFGVVIASLTLP